MGGSEAVPHARWPSCPRQERGATAYLPWFLTVMASTKGEVVNKKKSNGRYQCNQLCFFWSSPCKHEHLWRVCITGFSRWSASWEQTSLFRHAFPSYEAASHTPLTVIGWPEINARSDSIPLHETAPSSVFFRKAAWLRFFTKATSIAYQLLLPTRSLEVDAGCITWEMEKRE